MWRRKSPGTGDDHEDVQWTTKRRDRADLVFWLPAINPYWAKRLSELNASGKVDFECWFNSRRGAGRDWVVPPEDMKFDYVFLPPGPFRRYREVIRLYAAARPKKLLTFHFEPALWLALLHRLVPRRELAFYMEKTWESFVRRSRYKEALKRIILFSAADVVFVPGVDAAEYVTSTGAVVTIDVSSHTWLTSTPSACAETRERPNRVFGCCIWGK